MPRTKPRKTHALELTQLELVHLRDLFGVLLPVELAQTVSQALAAIEGRSLLEAKLWTKLCQLCNKAGVDTGDAAPDYVMGLPATPAVSVFRLASDEHDLEGAASDDRPTVNNVFDPEK